MKKIKSLYFSESISGKAHNRIINQLEKGNPKMKKDFHVIILKEDGDNLFEYIDLSEYMMNYENGHKFILIGAVKNYTEFTGFVMNFINKCLEEGIQINKKAIVNYILDLEELQ